MERVYGSSMSVKQAQKVLIARRAADREVQNKMELEAKELAAIKTKEYSKDNDSKRLFVMVKPVLYTLRRGKAYRRAYRAKKLFRTQLSLAEEDKEFPKPTAKELASMDRIYAQAMDSLA